MIGGLHANGMHWANDPVGRFIQSPPRPGGGGGPLQRRAVPQRRVGGQNLHELRALFWASRAAITGGLSPRIAPSGELRDSRRAVCNARDLPCGGRSVTVEP